MSVRSDSPTPYSEEWLRVTLSSIGDAVIVTDAQGNVTFMNSVAEALTGWAKDEAQNRPLEEVFPIINETSRARVENPVSRVLQTGTIVGLANHTLLLTKSGVEIPIDDSAAPMRDEQGNIYGIVLVFRDITERKRLEQSLGASEERLRLSHEVTGVGAWEWNSTTNEVFWSPEYRTIYGLDAHAEPSFEKGIAVVVEEDREMINRAISQALKSGEEYRSEHRINHPQKGLRWIQAIGRTMKGEQQSAVRMFGLAMDVTVQKKAEQEAREGAERFIKAFNASPLLMTVSSLRDGRLIEVNETFTQFSGYSRAEAVGQTTAELGLWSNLEDRKQELETLQETGRVSNVEYSFRKRNGEEVIGLLAAERIDIGGEPCALTVIQNITERKLAEQAVRDGAERLSLAMEAAELGDWNWEVATNVVTLSERAAEILGVRGAQISWAELKVLLYEGDHERASRAVEEAFATNSHFDIEYRIFKSGEEPSWIAAKGKAIYDMAAQLQGIHGVVQDITERKQDEEVRRLNEQRLHLALESSDLGMWSVQLPDNKTTSTPRNLEILGFPPEGPQPSPEELAARIHPEDFPRVSKTWSRCAERGELFDMEYRIVHPNGQVHWVASKGKSLADATGRPSKFIGICADITDQKQAELLLSEKEERHRLALEAGQIGTWDWDILNNHVVWSDLVYEFHGLKPGEFGGRVEDFAEIVHPDDRDRVSAAIQAALENKEPYSIEARLVWPNGEVHWIATKGKVFFASDGRPVRMIGATVEITERRRAEQGMLEKATEIQALLNAVPAAVFIAREPQAKIITGSRTAHTLLRIEPDESLSITATNGNLPLHFKLLKEGVEVLPGNLPVQLAARGIEVKDYDLEVLFNDGTSKNLFGNATPLRGPNGKIRGAISAFVDVTVLKQLEAALKESDRRKDEFLAMLAHELRNPLAPILNAVRVMRRMGPLPSQLVQMQDVIERQSQHLTRLVDDLLDIARISQGKIELRKEKIELLNIVERAVETSRPLIDARNHQLTISLPKEAVRLEGDLTRLAQVLSNLLNNAAKYTEEGGYISVTGEQKDDGILLRIKDNGMGIPKRDLPYVFDLFAQADRALDRRQGGLGIGLTLVKKLIEMHGGRVEAVSEGAGKGSEFVIHLPTLIESPAEAKWPSSANGTGESEVGNRCRILVVDDNVDSAESMALLLGLEGHEVQITYDGPSTLNLVRTFRPQVVLLDIGLPGMNGYEVAQQLRHDPEMPKIILIALTGYGQAEDRKRSQEAGFDHHFTKPVDHDQLASLIKSLILN